MYINEYTFRQNQFFQVKKERIELNFKYSAEIAVVTLNYLSV